MSDWNDLVRRGHSAKERLAQAKFELGDLAGEVETSYGGGQLQRYAEAIDLEYKTLEMYRWVSRAFPIPIGNRAKASWSVYQMLAGRDDRLDILAEQERWTVAEMRARLDKRQNYYSQDDVEETSRRAQALPVEQRAEIVREALHDPEVIKQVSEEITDHVADDPKLTAKVLRKHDDAPKPKPQRRTEIDYDEMIGRAVDWVTEALGAEGTGKWTPSDTSEALLYFLAKALSDRKAPTGHNATLVNDKLADLFREVEEYANTEAS